MRRAPPRKNWLFAGNPGKARELAQAGIEARRCPLCQTIRSPKMPKGYCRICDGIA